MNDQTRWLTSDEQHSWRGLLMGMTLLQDRLDKDLRQEYGISSAEYEILVRLSENEGSLRMAQLADSVAHSRSRITHTVTRMQGDGLVNRHRSSGDGRGIVATLTDEGWDLLRRAAHTHVEGVRTYLVDIVKPDDFAALGRGMNAVADNLIAENPDQCQGDIR